MADELGAETQYEVHLTDSIDGDKCVSRHLRLSPEQYEVVFRDPYIRAYVGKELPNYGGIKKTADIRPCGAGECSFCITPEGNLIPCCSFHLILGNLQEKSTKDIIQSNEILNRWRKTLVGDTDECGRYDYCDFCVLCCGNNYSEHHSYLKAGENNCYIAQIRYNLAVRMQAEGYEPLKGMGLTERLRTLDSEYSDNIKREKA